MHARARVLGCAIDRLDMDETVRRCEELIVSGGTAQHVVVNAEERGYRVFVLGARPDVLERAVERLQGRYPRLLVAGALDGYFRDEESAEVCTAIRAARPHILLVAISSPRKEYWLGRHIAELGVPFAMGVGGAIDVVAGITRRAPGWMQRAGLEWLFRLLQEPRRLARRYLVTNARFTFLVARELLRARLGSRAV